VEKSNEKGEKEYLTELGEKVEWVKESNYLFNFSPEIKKVVKAWATQDPSPIVPETILNLTLSDLDELKDHLSISRPSKRISWGISVPEDDTQTVYVWLDALTNYKTVCDSFPKFNGEMIHILGKDINKFHSLYWPSFLAAYGYPLPRQLLVHGHWKKDNLKMSKSIGNIVDPFELIRKYGPTAVRAYLLSAGPLYKDANFEEEELISLHDSLIVDGIVNMFFRCTGNKFLNQFDEIRLDKSKFTQEDLDFCYKIEHITQK
jgi:methionyl-tRNA synthetase